MVRIRNLENSLSGYYAWESFIVYMLCAKRTLCWFSTMRKTICDMIWCYHMNILNGLPNIDRILAAKRTACSSCPLRRQHTTRLVVILYSKSSPGLHLSFVSLRSSNSRFPCESSLSFLYPHQPKYLPVQYTNQFRENHFSWIFKFVTIRLFFQWPSRIIFNSLFIQLIKNLIERKFKKKF